MRVSMILFGTGTLAANASLERWVGLLSQSVPSVFLNEKLWTGGILAVLAAFLLWQSWVRERELRKEAYQREERMAARIDKLELLHGQDLTRVVESVHQNEELRNSMAVMSEQIVNNCRACDARREEIINKLDSIQKG